MKRNFFFALSLWAVVALPSNAEIFVPGQTVPNVDGEVFTWSEGQSDSTSAFWDTFASFPGGTTPGGIAPGTSPAANEVFNDGGADSLLTFDSFATILSSGNAYGFNFAPGQPDFQPEFIIDAFATVRSGTSGGNFTRIVAQWQTQGTELDDDSLLLSVDPDTEGTIAPDLSIETERTALGGFGGELITRLAVWDLDSSQDEYRIDFNAQANHMSFDQFRLDTFTQSTAFFAVTAVPEPSCVLWGSVVALGMAACRQRRFQRQHKHADDKKDIQS